MTLEIIIVLGLTAVAMVLFATERLSVDLVALMIMAVLLVTGLVTPRQGISGFGNTATVTIAAMFVLSAGVSRTGAVNVVGSVLTVLGERSTTIAVVATMILIGSVSAFVNNTAAVAILLPVVIEVARRLEISPTKLLMPLSFASMFGGTCTLIGTSTNILVSSIAEDHGEPAFGMFELAPLGLLFFGIGLAYMATVGMRLIPQRRLDRDLEESFGLGDYLTELVILPEAASVGFTLADAPVVRELNLDVLEITRQGERILFPPPALAIQAGDVMRVRCDVEQIQATKQQHGVELRPRLRSIDGHEPKGAVLVEAVLAPHSRLEGRSVEDADLWTRDGATVLAIRHREQILREPLRSARMQAGDALLVEVGAATLNKLKSDRAFVVVSEIELESVRTHKVVPALAIIFGVVATAATGLLPIVASAVAGCVLMVLTNCLNLEEAYDAIEWRVIFLLAGILTLGIAMENTGAAQLISDQLLWVGEGFGRVGLLSSLYLLTVLLTSVISNNATAALLAPIAITTAHSLGVDPRPFLMAVTFGASASFMTPVGYQTNTLVYAAGQYRFSDFLKVGTPLTLIFWLLGTYCIPLLWSF